MVIVQMAPLITGALKITMVFTIGILLGSRSGFLDELELKFIW
jgi:hypothetical protein